MADNVLRERLYLGDGAGRFTDASAGVPDDAFNNDHDHDLEMADLTGDGLPEAILAVDNVHNGPGGGLYRGSNRVLRNLGGGRFERLRVPELDEMLGDMLDVDAVDIDGDGDRDLLVANSGRPSRLLMNDGAGGFSAAPPGMFETDSAGTFEVSAGDVDGDGDLDLAVANFSLSSLRPGEANRLFVNDGTGRMHDADASWPESRLNSTDVVFEDFDGDGVAELFVCNFDGESILLRQVPAP